MRGDSVRLRQVDEVYPTFSSTEYLDDDRILKENKILNLTLLEVTVDEIIIVHCTKQI